jgi:TatD DNase family protein
MTNLEIQGLIDIGANLTHESFQHDLDEVLDRASAAGVRTIVVTGASAQGSHDALALAQQYPQLCATAGVHPHEADSYSADTGKLLRELGKSEEVVAMGECGLDFYRDLSPRRVQEKCFEAQLEIACEAGKPVFLHERDAHDRFVKILEPYLEDLPAAVVHCFTGTESQLDAYLEMGCHIGITGWICDERRGHHLREFVYKIPTGRLMLETDAPYLLPRDLKPKPKTRRNEPMHLAHIAKVIADITGKPIEQLAAETTQTAERFFNIKALTTEDDRQGSAEVQIMQERSSATEHTEK